MATRAQIVTWLEALDAEEAALISAQDFDIATGTAGGRLAIRGTAEKLKYLQQRRVQLKKELWRIDGCKTIEPARAGIDIARESDNGDGVI